MAMVLYLPVSYYIQWTNMDIVHAEKVFVRTFVIPREDGLIDVTEYTSLVRLLLKQHLISVRIVRSNKFNENPKESIQ